MSTTSVDKLSSGNQKPSLLSRLWHSLVKPFFWHIVVAGLIFAMGWCAAYYKQRRTFQPLHHLWDSAVLNSTAGAKDPGVAVVVGGFPITAIDTGFGIATDIPENVLVVADGDAIAAADLHDVLAREFPNQMIDLQVSAEFQKIRSTVVSVGGASVNTTTRDLLAKLDKGLQIVYPEHYAKDGAQRYDASYEKNAGGQPQAKRKVTEDYGFIVVGPNPYNNARTVFLAFGIWPQGTYAAVEALMYPDEKTEKGKELMKKIQNRNAVGIVKTKVNRYGRGYPEIVKVRDLKQ